MAAEVIFTKGCTESINIVARGSDADLQKGDVILLTLLEHHSNVVPWQQLATRTGAIMKWIETDDEGNLNLDQYKKYVAEGNVKIVALTGQSNVLGVRPPLKEMIADAHKAGAIVLVDAAQLVAHHAIDVQDLDCDFLAFSGHKIYGPTGIGIFYGKRALLEKMPPMLGGGSMISEVTKDGFKSADIPAKFEAGTPAITQAIGLRASIDWLTQYTWKEIEAHEQTLLRAALEGLQKIEGLKILGPLELEKISGCVSFVIDGIHAHDLTEVLGRQGICLRAGHHCCQPLHDRFGITASTRLSVGIYNTVEEIQQACSTIEEVQSSFQNS